MPAVDTSSGKSVALLIIVWLAVNALALGVVAEVLPDTDLQGRAWELGTALERKPLLALRNTRQALTRRIRRELNDDLDIGLALEGLGLLSLRE